MILISGCNGLIGTAISRHLWPLAIGYDKGGSPAQFDNYDAFIDCARYDNPLDQTNVLKLVAEYFKKIEKGRMILFSSIYGHKAPRFDIYTGTDIGATTLEYAYMKGGIEQATRHLAEYLKPWNVQVNAIAPGGVMDNHSGTFQDAYQYAGNAPMIQTYNLFPVVDMLLHPDSKVNGEVITVDGGWIL